MKIISTSILFLVIFITNLFGQSSTCNVSQVVLTPVIGNPFEYNLSFKLTLSVGKSGMMTIMGINPNGGQITNVPNFLVNVNHGPGTHIFNTKVVLSSPAPTTPVNLIFSMGRGCSSTVSVAFPPPTPQCLNLTPISINCLPGNATRMSYTISGITGNFVNGTLSIEGISVNLGSPSTGGVSVNPNTINFNLGNPPGGVFNFSFNVVHTPSQLTPSVTFVVKNPNGQILCATQQQIRPYPSICGPNRCNRFTVDFTPANLLTPSNTVYSNFTINPASEANITQVTISLVNFEVRQECPNSAPTAWTKPANYNDISLNQNGSGFGPNLGGASVVNQPMPNSLQFNGSGSPPSSSGDHTLTFRGFPPKQNPNCTERIRIKLRYVIRNASGCEVEFYRYVELTR